MADELITSASTESGKQIVIPVAPGAELPLDFDITQAEVVLDGTNMVATMEDGTVYIFEGFVEIALGDNPPAIVLEDGTVLPGDIVVQSIQEGGEIAPAAGPGATSGGAGEFRTDTGNVADGIDALGDVAGGGLRTGLDAGPEDEGVAVPTITLITDGFDTLQAPEVALSEISETTTQTLITFLVESVDALDTVGFTPGSETSLNGQFTSNGEPVVFSFVGEDIVGVANGETIMTLDLVDQGAGLFSVELIMTGPVDHSPGDGQNTISGGTIGIFATDVDGDTATLSLGSLTIIDGVPDLSIADDLSQVELDDNVVDGLLDESAGPGPVIESPTILLTTKDSKEEREPDIDVERTATFNYTLSTDATEIGLHPDTLSDLEGLGLRAIYQYGDYEIQFEQVSSTEIRGFISVEGEYQYPGNDDFVTEAFDSENGFFEPQEITVFSMELVLEPGEGRTGTGYVEFKLDAPILHPEDSDAIVWDNLRVVADDFDGDSDTITLNEIVFVDDKPEIEEVDPLDELDDVEDYDTSAAYGYVFYEIGADGHTMPYNVDFHPDMLAMLNDLNLYTSDGHEVMFRQDGPGSIVGYILPEGGENGVYDLRVSEVEYQPEPRDIMFLSLSNFGPGTVRVSATLHDALDHSIDPLTGEEIRFEQLELSNVLIRITDYDGDYVDADAGTIIVNDEAPQAQITGLPIVLWENYQNGLWDFDIQSNVVVNYTPDPVESITFDTSVVNPDGTLGDNVLTSHGEPIHFVAESPTEIRGYLNYGEEGQTSVMKLILVQTGENTAKIVAKLDAPIDHPVDADSLYVEGLDILVTDVDGSVTSLDLEPVKILDLHPVAAPIGSESATEQDSGDSYSGFSFFSYSFAPDGPADSGAIQFTDATDDNLNNLGLKTSDGRVIQWQFDGDDIIGVALPENGGEPETVATLTIHPGSPPNTGIGWVEAEFTEPLYHPQQLQVLRGGWGHSGEEGDDYVRLSGIELTFLDYDGDNALVDPITLSPIKIWDTEPEVKADYGVLSVDDNLVNGFYDKDDQHIYVKEGADESVLDFTSDVVQANKLFGYELTSHGEIIHFVHEAPGLVVGYIGDRVAVQLSIEPDGTSWNWGTFGWDKYEVVLKSDGPIDHPEGSDTIWFNNLNVVITDADGDSDFAYVGKIRFTDDEPRIWMNGRADKLFLEDNHPDGEFDTAYSKTFHYYEGDDGAELHFTDSAVDGDGNLLGEELYSGGERIVFAHNGDSIVGTVDGETIMTISLVDLAPGFGHKHGQVKVTLDGPVDHVGELVHTYNGVDYIKLSGLRLAITDYDLDTDDIGIGTIKIRDYDPEGTIERPFPERLEPEEGDWIQSASVVSVDFGPDGPAEKPVSFTDATLVYLQGLGLMTNMDEPISFDWGNTDHTVIRGYYHDTETDSTREGFFIRVVDGNEEGEFLVRVGLKTPLEHDRDGDGDISDGIINLTGLGLVIRDFDGEVTLDLDPVPLTDDTPEIVPQPVLLDGQGPELMEGYYGENDADPTEVFVDSVTIDPGHDELASFGFNAESIETLDDLIDWTSHGVPISLMIDPDDPAVVVAVREGTDEVVFELILEQTGTVDGKAVFAVTAVSHEALDHLDFLPTTSTDDSGGLPVLLDDLTLPAPLMIEAVDNDGDPVTAIVSSVTFLDGVPEAGDIYAIGDASGASGDATLDFINGLDAFSEVLRPSDDALVGLETADGIRVYGARYGVARGDAQNSVSNAIGTRGVLNFNTGDGPDEAPDYANSIGIGLWTDTGKNSVKEDPYNVGYKGEFHYHDDHPKDYVETFVVELPDGSVATGGSIDFSTFFADETVGWGWNRQSYDETARVLLYLNGELKATEPVTATDASGGLLSYTIAYEGPFDRIEIEPTDATRGSTGDNSDFRIGKIDLDLAPDNELVATTGQLPYEYGQDGPLGGDLSDSIMIDSVSGSAYTLDGDEVSWHQIDEHQWHGKDEGGAVVATVVLDPAGGEVTFTPTETLVGDPVDPLAINYQVTDFDLDTESGTMYVNPLNLTGDVPTTFIDGFIPGPEGPALDITDILSDLPASVDLDGLNDRLDFAIDGSDTIISVKDSGGDVQQQVVLKDVELDLSGGERSLLAQLISNDDIKVDEDWEQLASDVADQISIMGGA